MALRQNLFKQLSNMFSGSKDTNAFKQGEFKIGPCSGEPQKQNERNGFFDAIKKVSGLEIENKTFEKLKTIAKISDSGKTGTITGDGVGWVFGKMNWPLPEQLGSVVKSFNPQVANGAIGAAKQIAEKVKQRNFKFEDIPEVIQDMGNFEAMLGGIFTPETPNKRSIKCEAIDYAMDFAKDYGMKYKFLFVVEFVPNDSFYSAINGGINPAAFVKDFTMPQIAIEHEEVNMYNLRTKIPKFINFQNANMTFYDDGRNHVMSMITNYLKTMSPAFRLDNPLTLETYSQGYGDISNSSSLRVLDDSSVYSGLTTTNDSTKNILKEIRVYHVFMSGHYFNMYSFLNPRFSNITIEQLSMEENAVSMVSTEFNYDTMYIEPNRPFYSDKHSGSLQTSSILATGITYKGMGAPDTKPNNNSTDSSDPIDGSVVGGIVNEAINGATTSLINNSLHDFNKAQAAFSDSDTLRNAAASSYASGDMESYKTYNELADKKTTNANGLLASSRESRVAAQSIDPDIGEQVLLS